MWKSISLIQKLVLKMHFGASGASNKPYIIMRRLVILLLCTVLSVTSCCIFVELYRTVINLKLNFMGRNHSRFFISNSIFVVNPGVPKEMPKFKTKVA